jgi:hypothetical protein
VEQMGQNQERRDGSAERKKSYIGAELARRRTEVATPRDPDKVATSDRNMILKQTLLRLRSSIFFLRDFYL